MSTSHQKRWVTKKEAFNSNCLPTCCFLPEVPFDCFLSSHGSSCSFVRNIRCDFREEYKWTAQALKQALSSIDVVGRETYTDTTDTFHRVSLHIITSDYSSNTIEPSVWTQLVRHNYSSNLSALEFAKYQVQQLNGY